MTNSVCLFVAFLFISLVSSSIKGKFGFFLHLADTHILTTNKRFKA